MTRVVRVATLLSAVFVVIPACSHQLKLAREQDERSDIRQEYLLNNPNGQFNDHIIKNEVVKGMSVIEVLASWGLPDMRRAYSKTDSDIWTYYSVDVPSGQVASFDLVFEDRLLRRWVVVTEVMTLEKFYEQEAAAGQRISTTRPGGLSGDVGSLKKP